MGDVVANFVPLTIVSNKNICKLQSNYPRSYLQRIRFWSSGDGFYADSVTKSKIQYPVMANLRNVLTLQLNMPKMGFLNGITRVEKTHLCSDMLASVKSSLICEDEGANECIQGEEELDASFVHKKNLPPWGEVVSGESQDSEPPTSMPTLYLEEMSIREEPRAHILEEMDENVLSNRLLVLSRTNKIRSAMELFRSMELSGVHPNIQACNSLISCLLRNGELDNGLKLFSFMRKKNLTTPHTYSLMLKAVASVEGCTAALEMFSELEGECNVKRDFDAIVYNTIISICGKNRNGVEIEKIWKSMKANGCVGTEVTYCLLVCCFVRCGQTELAIDAYHEMVQNGLEADNDAIHAMIGACAKEGKWDYALYVFQKMLEDGLRPNLVACNALINSLGKAGKVKLAFEVYDVMKSLGHSPDAYAYNALLNSLYKANMHDLALQLYEKIKRTHACPLNTHLCNTALMSCSKLGLWDRALQILWQMEDCGLSVSTESYNLVIRACEVAKKPKVSLQVYEHMVDQKCKPDTFTYLSMIRGCIWGSLWDGVEKILNSSEPNVSLYNAAIQGMCLRGKIDLAKKLYSKMHKYGFQPDGKTRALMLQNLAKDY